jgi:nicotinate-nucleotide pyrophosphorylase (carboxylating)
VRFETLRDFAVLGIDVISIGALTHSAPSVDLSLTVPMPKPAKKPAAKKPATKKPAAKAKAKKRRAA